MKKRAKADLMGFLCCRISVMRGDELQAKLNQELLYPCYLYSTAMIFKNFEKKYSEQFIREIEMNCDRFYLKKHKESNRNALLEKREQIQKSLSEGSYVQDFLLWTGMLENEWIIHDALTSWMDMPFLLDDTIKSM